MLKNLKKQDELVQAYELENLVLKTKLDVLNLVNAVNIKEEKKDIALLILEVDEIFKSLRIFARENSSPYKTKKK